jgi:hypothetical protein
MEAKFTLLINEAELPGLIHIKMLSLLLPVAALQVSYLVHRYTK